MFKRKVWIGLIAFLLILIFSLNIFAGEIEEETDYIWLEEEIIDVSNSNIVEPNIYSKCAIVLDRNSKTVLWGKNENTRVPMASTTKIMTAIVLLESIEREKVPLDTIVEVCKEAASIGGSRLGLKTGDKITINDLLYGLMLCSGNDCAIQIAVSISGSIENFIELMNNKAKELNLNNTHFVTPHGLDREEHYTSAYELALIADYALNIKKIAEVVNTKSYNVLINGYNKNISNTNELLGYLEGVNGVKTGFTNKAGRCLVTSVNRNNFKIIVVVLGANTKKIRTKDSINLIEYIYQNYELIDLNQIIEEEFEKWKEINEKRIKVEKGNKESLKTSLEEIKLKKYPIKKGENNNIKLRSSNIYKIEAPITSKEQIGSIKICIGEKEIANINIEIVENIGRKSTWEYFNVLMENYIKAFKTVDIKQKAIYNNVKFFNKW